jgi:hypothetical protein
MPATRISTTHFAVVPAKAGIQLLLLPTWVTGNARNLFRAGARVTFFGAKKVTKESMQVQFKSAVCDLVGIFLRDILVS